MSGLETKRARNTRESTREDKRKDRDTNNGGGNGTGNGGRKPRGNKSHYSSKDNNNKDSNTNGSSERRTRTNERTKYNLNSNSASAQTSTSSSNSGFRPRNLNQTQPSYSSFFSSSTSSHKKSQSQTSYRSHHQQPVQNKEEATSQIKQAGQREQTNKQNENSEHGKHGEHDEHGEHSEPQEGMGSAKIMSWSKIVSKGKEEPKLVDYEIDTPNGEMRRSEVLKTHWKLNNSWTLWVHDVQNPNWGEDDYTQMGVIKTVNNVYSCCNNIKTFSEQMYFLMKGNIFPNWENEANRNGGAWSLKINKKIAGQRASESDRVWMELLMALVGGYLTENADDMKYINGITISPKQTHHCIIKIWNNDKTKSDSSVISQSLFEDYVNSKLPIKIRGKDEMISYFDHMIYRAHCEQSDFKQK